MTKRKIGVIALLVMIVLALLVQLILPLRAGSASLDFTKTAQTVHRGDSITLTVRSNGASSMSGGLDGYSGTLTYDSSVLSLGKVTGSIEGWAFNKSESSGQFNFIGYDNNPPALSQKTEVDLFTVTFKVLSSAPNGDSLVSIKNGYVADAAFKEISAQGSTSVVTIVDQQAPSKSSNNNLQSISVKDSKGNSVALTPAFSSSNTSYAASVGSEINSISIEGLVSDSKARIKSGVGNTTLKTGINTITVVVEAEDGTEKTYTFTITKEASSTDPKDPKDPNAPITVINNNNNTNNNIANGGNATSNNSSSNNYALQIYGVSSLSPSFDKDVSNYIAKVGREVESLDIRVITEDSSSVVKIIGADNLKIGENTIKVCVTSKDGKTREYTIVVTKTNEESNSLLSGLQVGAYSLNPVFKESVFYYNLSVDYDVSTLAVNATPKYANTTLSIEGNTRLNVGTNLIKVTVNDSEGNYNRYIVEVTRLASTEATKSTSDSLLSNNTIITIGLIAIVVLLLCIVLILSLRKPTVINNTNTNTNTNGNPVPPVYTRPENYPPIPFYQGPGSNGVSVVNDVNSDLSKDQALQEFLASPEVDYVIKEYKIYRNDQLNNQPIDKEINISYTYRKKKTHEEK